MQNKIHQFKNIVTR